MFLLKVILCLSSINIRLATSLQVDQCNEEDVFFTKSKVNIEIQNEASQWSFTFSTNEFHKCFEGCKLRNQCVAATFFANRKECRLQDVHRGHITTKIILSDDAQFFERRECPTGVENDKRFIMVVPNASDCRDVYQKGWKVNGMYGVKGEGDFYRPMLCKMDIYGGGWTVIQNRFDGSNDFRKPWDVYKAGFGDLARDFWYGNDMIHNMTKKRDCEILFVLKGSDEKVYYPLFKKFHVGSEQNKYNLTIDDYKFIDQGEPLNETQNIIDRHSGQFFTTMDVDNDKRLDDNCSVGLGGSGGWWYKSCHTFNLNGGRFGENVNAGTKWNEITGHACIKGCLKETAMLIRRKIKKK